MSCGAKFKIEVFDPSTSLVIWSSVENFKHNSDACESCMASELKFSVLGKCSETDVDTGLIIFNGKIVEDDFFKIYEIQQTLVDDIRNSGTYKCRIKKVECTCEETNYPSDSYFVYKSCKDDLHFYVNDDFDYNPSSSGLTDEEQIVYGLKSEIMEAGYKSNDTVPLISPATIAMILLDELNRRTLEDTLQEQANIPLIVVKSWSYGIGQIKPETLADLINKGYYPPVTGYDGDADGFISKRALYLEIMSDENNPRIIAGFMQRVIDRWSLGTDGSNSTLKGGKKSADAGFDISEMPHVLATLFTKPPMPVHNNPGGLENRWDTPGSVANLMYVINNKMGIPSAPARFLDITPVSRDGSSFMCLEYQEKINASIDKNSTSEFIDSKGRKSRYFAPYSLASDPMFRRTQSMCEMCK